MEMMDMAADDTREELRRKLRSNFDGRIVRKDLTKKIKEGANVPVYVLEFLLGQYCSSDDETIISMCWSSCWVSIVVQTMRQSLSRAFRM